MRIVLKDYGEHGAVTLYGDDAMTRLYDEFVEADYSFGFIDRLPDGVTRREFSIEAEPVKPCAHTSWVHSNLRRICLDCRRDIDSG